jgi:prepilin-type processing-associated H-X9-DG protein
MRKVAVVISLALAAAVVVAAGLPQVTHRMRLAESGGRQRCPSNLRQIGTAIALYANDHGGAYPDDFRTLLSAGDDGLSTGVFICSDTSTKEARSAAAFTGTAADCDYVYVGDGLTSSVGDDVIVAFDRAENHEHDGINMLFGDGHVYFFLWPERKTPPIWTKIENQIARHVRPVRLPKAAMH